MSKYIIGIDQSTQGTKALLFDELGNIVLKKVKNHAQLINDKGWVSHDLGEIYNNVLDLINELIHPSNINSKDIVGVGISDQRETSAAWEKGTGRSLAKAIVWQDSRSTDIVDRPEIAGKSEIVKKKTGINLSPYFPASKFAWLLENVPEVKKARDNDSLCLGTIDSWLLYKLTNGKSFKTEPGNASRTQLLNIKDVAWDKELCDIFNVPMKSLPEVVPSNSNFGETNFNGLLDQPIPINCMLGDSMAALYGQGCWEVGNVKATIGTGSSVMMNTGRKQVNSNNVVTSIGWKMGDDLNYVVEGNINYAGAVISWLKDDVKLIDSAKETEQLALQAIPNDHTYLIPAFSGLGAPYWDSKATASLSGMSRTTGKAEIVRAALDSIAFQIRDILATIDEEADIKTNMLKVDGGVTSNSYLMQFQSNISDTDVYVPNIEEFSAFGVAFCAGRALGLYNNLKLDNIVQYHEFHNQINETKRDELVNGWTEAIETACRK